MQKDANIKDQKNKKYESIISSMADVKYQAGGDWNRG